jgi:hypothetical protein
MLSGLSSQNVTGSTLPVLDRVVIAYLTLPLAIFVAGWLQPWAALPLLACLAYSLRSLLGGTGAGPPHLPVSALQLGVAVLVGLAWTYCGGTGHFVFANADWYVRDAVLHDLVASPWPVGYGALDGAESLLRAPVAYYLPAALVGKWLGLPAAHLALAAWTGLGASLFLLQVLSLTPSRLRAAIPVALIIVFFSGMDIVGNLINIGPRFIALWHIENHLEWWAGTYQYSSMTTQLFWVPNHALCGWLTIGLLARDRRGASLGAVLPIIVVAGALWSPLTTLGVVPFVLWRVGTAIIRDRSLQLLHPRVWAPALVVGLVVAAYLTLDLGNIRRGMSGGGGHEALVLDLLRQAQFFLLEAGLIGMAILFLRRSSEVILALVILAILPLAWFGPGNDLVMRASIPSLAVLAIAACLALLSDVQVPARRWKRFALSALLAVGGVTAVQEFARAFRLPVWPINQEATLIGVNCGKFPAHYVARLGGELVGRLLREPQRLALGPQGRGTCANPAWILMYRRGLLQL